MGTRATVRIFEVRQAYDDEGEAIDGETKEKQILQMYRQFDGYPDGMGSDLMEFLEQVNLMNGINESKKEDDLIDCNGAGELAAKFVAYMKDKYPSGNIYLQPVDDATEWWNYDVYVSMEPPEDGCAPDPSIDRIEVDKGSDIATVTDEQKLASTEALFGDE